MRILISTLFLLVSFMFTVASEAKPVPAEHYARLPAVYDAAISPNGSTLATIIDSKGSYIVSFFDLTDAAKKNTGQVRIADGVRVAWIEWANNDLLLASTYETVKTANSIYNTGNLFVLDRKKNTIELALKPKRRRGAKTGSNLKGGAIFRQFNNEIVDMLHDDPDHVLMSYGSSDQRKIGVHRVNLNTKRTERIEPESYFTQNWITDLSGKIRVVSGIEETSGMRNLRIRLADNEEWHDISEYPGIDMKTSIFGFAEEPNEMVVGLYQGKDTIGLYIYDLSKKLVGRKLFHDEGFDARGVVLSPDGKKIVGARYTTDTRTTAFFDPAYRERLAKLGEHLEGYQISIIDQTPDGGKIVFKASGASTPAALFLYDKEIGKPQLLSYDYPEIGATIQGDVTKVKYPTRDGYKISGYLTTPPKIADGMPLKNLPFIILPHGGPYARDTMTFDYLAQFFASRGYAVLQMNFRGSIGMGNAHEQAGRKNWVLMQDDVEDGARWLVEKGYADPNRICIAGWSYGGYAALMGAVKNPDLYKCAISIAGVTDLRDMIRDIRRYRFGYQSAHNFILRGFKDKDDLRANSPVKRAEEFTVPLLIAHGTKDSVVRYDQFTRMKSALKNSPAKKTYLSLKNGDHSLTSANDRLKLFKEMDKFLRDNLGESEAAP